MLGVFAVSNCAQHVYYKKTVEIRQQFKHKKKEPKLDSLLYKQCQDTTRENKSGL